MNRRVPRVPCRAKSGKMASARSLARSLAWISLVYASPSRRERTKYRSASKGKWMMLKCKLFPPVFTRHSSSFPFYLRFLSLLPFSRPSPPPPHSNPRGPPLYPANHLVLSSRRVTRNKTRQQYSSLFFVLEFFARLRLCVLVIRIN